MHHDLGTNDSGTTRCVSRLDATRERGWGGLLDRLEAAFGSRGPRTPPLRPKKQTSRNHDLHTHNVFQVCLGALLKSLLEPRGPANNRPRASHQSTLSLCKPDEIRDESSQT
eukprot:5567593-Pyramimonas_sp.AAC.2